MNDIFYNISFFAQNLLNNVILSGDCVIDATVGNGNDTLFLAQKVGEKGKVYGFDVQLAAIQNTASLLEQHGLAEQVQLIHDGHQNMLKYVNRPVKAVMFNLGYLPQSDHKIITLPETTIEALRQSTQLLQTGGVITVIVYQGHSGGEREGEEVALFLKKLDSRKWDCLLWSFINRSPMAPYLYLIHKRGG
ncbi:MAG: methyltransferase domain-containing protein [Clostridia bacterium]|nr:methyltransferase domain-containing protein [Clostridia bacterium]